VVSHDHEVCLAAEHAERRASPSTTEFGVLLPKVQKSIKWKNPEQDFFDDCSMAWQIRFKSELAHYSSQ